MRRPCPLFLIATALIVPLTEAAVEFAKEIQPILEENCLDCHGPEKKKSAFRVDRRVALLKGGTSGIAAVVPGNPQESFLLEAVKGTDPDMQMPPKGDPLSPEQIAKLEAWIAEGAEWPGQMDEVVETGTDHWSFQPVERPGVPSGAGHPVDAFLKTKLEGAGLAPNRAAEARALIRRAAIVLTGLPPTPERVAAFETAHAANADEAYEELIDGLLASEHFGERWAQHWLDVIRWAETNGSEANLYRKNAWVYRDYVIRSFNNDLPYDQFIREQLAGDTMGVGEATGFLVAGPHVPPATVGQEPTAIRQARADRMDEIIQTVSASMMGITMSCARCHNHKFDPVSIQDYYSMTAVFQDLEFGGRFPEFADDHPRKMRGSDIWKRIAAQRKILRQAGPWEEDWIGLRELHFPAVETTALRVQFKSFYVGVDELEIFGPANRKENLAAASLGTTVNSPKEMVKDGRNHIGRINDGEYGTNAWRAAAVKGKPGKPWAEFTFSGPRTVNKLKISSNREYFYDTDYLDGPKAIAFKDYAVAVKSADGTWQVIADTQQIKQRQKQNPEQASAVAELNRKIRLLGEEGPQPSFVGRFIKPVVTHVLHRGSPESPRNEVLPAGPAGLDGKLELDSQSPGPERRRRFGEWLAQADHPLTARVMVNRIWHHVFGSGIVPTTSDFGVAGAPPAHPELLDWLAAEFAEPTRSGAKPWSMKDQIRLLVMSDAFRRSSAPTEAGMRADAGSAWLWRYPPQRVEAEVIRDGILQASGKLDRPIGGRSYRIHNVKKTYAQWQVVDNHGPETWRRMIYQERMRRVDDRIFTAFDFPDCGQVRAKRPVSTTPLQALNLMNSDFVVEQAQFLAERAGSETEGEGTAGAVRRCFELLLTRQPDADEFAACVEVARSNGLPIVCRSLMNSNEFAFLP